MASRESLSRLTVDGNNDLVTQVTNVLDNDPQAIVHTFLNTPIVVIPVGAATPVPNSTDGSVYYHAMVVPILPTPAPVLRQGSATANAERQSESYS